MADRLVLLGTKGGPAVRRGSAMPTSSLLELAGRRIVVDCGIGVTRALAEAGAPLTEIDAVFVSHLHSDHVLELGPLLHTAWTTGRKAPVAVFGPEGTEAYLDGFMASMAYDNAIRVADEGRVPLESLVDFRRICPGFSAGIGPVSVTALKVDHPPVTECYALRFEAGGKAVAFSADTAHFPPLAEFARDADVLVHEAMLTDAIEPLVARTGGGEKLRRHLWASHTAAADAGRIAAEAGVGHLCLNHLVPADDPDFTEADWEREVRRSWAGRLSVGRDGMELPL